MFNQFKFKMTQVLFIRGLVTLLVSLTHKEKEV